VARADGKARDQLRRHVQRPARAHQRAQEGPQELKEGRLWLSMAGSTAKVTPTPVVPFRLGRVHGQKPVTMSEAIVSMTARRSKKAALRERCRGSCEERSDGFSVLWGKCGNVTPCIAQPDSP
jgi:hypothetical protein